MRKIRAAFIIAAAGFAFHVPTVVAAPVEETAAPVDKSDAPIQALIVTGHQHPASLQSSTMPKN